MAAIVRSENDLPTLRAHLRRERQPVAVLEVLRGSGAGREVATVPTAALGLADWIRSARDVVESFFTVPPEVAEAVRTGLELVSRHEDRAFWLELPPPRGYLHLVPWERLLSPVLDRPLLRLPHFTLRPQAPGPSLRVVLAAGRSSSKPPFPVVETVEQLTVLWQAIHHQVDLEVFVTGDDARAVQERLSGQAAVTVHDLDDLAGSSESAPDGWLGWVESALAGRAADVVHFVAHGMLLGEHGALTLPGIRSSAAELPGTVGSVELCAALDRIGAWSLLISAPPRNHCPAGLRDLADAVAQARPGVVALHELDVPHGAGIADTFGPVLRMIYDGVSATAPTPGLVCWTHPAFAAFPDNELPLCRSDGTSALIAEATNSVLAQADTPAWVAAGTRTLEALQARVIPTDGRAADPQAVAALEAVSKLFDEHVRAFALPVAGAADGGEVTP
jgi:hypothetical protein